MKWFNWKSWFKSPRFQKWGLFCLLAVSLGFNLSMNPEHFNNIARYEKGSPMPSFELAQTAPPAAIPVAAASGEKVRTVTLGGNKGTFNVEVFEVRGKTFASFKKVQSQTEASVNAPGACDLCGIAAMPLNASFDKIDDVNIELLAHINGKKKDEALVPTTVVAEATKICPMEMSPKPKAGSLTEISDEALKACAQKCVSKKGEEKATCHQERLVELAKLLEDSDAQASVVEKYFKTNLYSSLKNGLMNPTVYETTPQECMSASIDFEGRSARPVYASSFGMVGCSDTSQLKFSRSILESLMSELPSTNGKGVMKLLVYLEKASMTAQASAAQEIARAGLRENNPNKLSFGMDNLNPMNLQMYLSQRTSGLLSLLGQREDTSLNGLYRNMIMTGFNGEMTSLLEGMKRCGSAQNQNNQTVQQQPNSIQPALQNCQTFLDYQLPVYDGMPTGNAYNPGQPGNTVVMRTGFSRGTPNLEWIQLLGSSINSNNINNSVIAPQQNQVIQNQINQPGAPLNRGRGGRG